MVKNKLCVNVVCYSYRQRCTLSHAVVKICCGHRSGRNRISVVKICCGLKNANWLLVKMWFSIVCTLIDKEYASSHLSKRCRVTRLHLLSPHFDNCDDPYSLSVRVQTTLNHILFVKYYYSQFALFNCTLVLHLGHLSGNTRCNAFYSNFAF